MNLEEKYTQVRDTPTDINEHVPTLYKYSKECQSVLELGVRSAVSSFAFIKGLTDNDLGKRVLVSCDVNPVTSEENRRLINKYCTKYNIDYTFLLKNDLEITSEEVSNIDLTFIDTWHIYGQMKRELAKFAPITNKYIVMHEQMFETIYLTQEEFLQEHPEWKIDHHVTNNNGLTVLKRQ